MGHQQHGRARSPKSIRRPAFAAAAEQPRIYNYLILLAAGIGLLLLWWAADLRDQTARDVWVVESTGELSFRAQEGQTVLTGIGLCADDAEAAAAGESSVTLSGTIHILDSDQLVVWETGFTDLEIPVFQIEELEGLVEETVELMQGETYTLVFYDESLQEVSGITWSFYGEERSAGGLYLLVCLGTVLLLFFLRRSRFLRDPVRAYVPVFIIAGCSVVLILLSFFCLPGEMDDLKEAYALSGLILKGLPGASSLSEAIPSGLLRLADHADAQTMTLFWAGGSYGNVSLSLAETFVSGATGMDLRSVVPAIALTLVRLLQLPYQFYLIVPRLANALFYLGMLLVGIRLCPGLRNFLVAFSLLPSTILLINSFSGQVWETALCLIFVCLCVEIRGLKGHCKGAGREFRRGDPAVPGQSDPAAEEKERTQIRGKKEKGGPLRTVYLVYIVMAVIIAVMILVPNLAANFGSSLTTGTMLEWIVSYPWKTFIVYVRTILQSGDLLVEMAAGPYGVGGTTVLLTLASAVCFLAAASQTAGRLLPAKGSGPHRAPEMSGRYPGQGTFADPFRETGRKKSGETSGETGPVTSLDPSREVGPKKLYSAGRIAGKVLIFGSLYIMTAALFAQTGTEYLWDYYMIDGLQGSDFLPLLLAVPFIMPRPSHVSRCAEPAQALQPVLTVLCLLAWFGAALHGIG